MSHCSGVSKRWVAVATWASIAMSGCDLTGPDADEDRLPELANLGGRWKLEMTSNPADPAAAGSNGDFLGPDGVCRLTPLEVNLTQTRVSNTTWRLQGTHGAGALVCTHIKPGKDWGFFPVRDTTLVIPAGPVEGEYFWYCPQGFGGVDWACTPSLNPEPRLELFLADQWFGAVPSSWFFREYISASSMGGHFSWKERRDGGRVWSWSGEWRAYR